MARRQRALGPKKRSRREKQIRLMNPCCILCNMWKCIIEESFNNPNKERCCGCCSIDPPRWVRNIMHVIMFFLSHYTPPLLVVVTCNIFVFNYFKQRKISRCFPLTCSIVCCTNLSFGLLLIWSGRKVWTRFRLSKYDSCPTINQKLHRRNVALSPSAASVVILASEVYMSELGCFHTAGITCASVGVWFTWLYDR